MSIPAVRRATPADAEALADVAAATFGLACPPDTLPDSVQHFIETVLSVERFQAYLADAARELFVVERADPAAALAAALDGYAMLVHGDPVDADAAAAVQARPTAELSKLYVRPDAHGSGLAAALVEVCVDAARERGAASLWLGVNQQNARANRFYDKSGFARVGTKRFRVGVRWEHDYVRERPLEGAA